MRDGVVEISSTSSSRDVTASQRTDVPLGIKARSVVLS
jgi:hypothetical protein